MSATYLRPGVFINETLTALATPVTATATSVACFIGAADRGPTVPTLVDSWSTFSTLFGTFTDSAELAYAVYFYFLNGGSPCYVTRVAHSDAVAATRVLNDTAGSPLPTLGLTAANVGAWGNGITIDITAGYTSGRFNLVVHFGGTQVEVFQDMSMTSSDARYAPVIINAGSQYLVATDEGSTTSPPNNIPAVQTGTSLASGANGSSAAANDYLASANLHNSIPQPLIVNLPGVTDNTTITDIQTWADSLRTAFVVIDTTSSVDVADALSYAATLNASSRSAVYYPWIVASDPSRPNSGGVTVTIPPGGPVLAQYVVSDAQAGPWKTPAGTGTSIAGAVSLAASLQPSDYDSLNSANPPVNAIKPVSGYGICVFGGRTLQGGFPSMYVAIRRSLTYIEQSLINLTQYAVFEPNDDALWATLSADVTSWLTDYQASGGLAGSTPAQGFFVTCDSTNNTPGSIQAGQVNITVGVALEFPAEFVIINIGQYAGSSTSSTSLDTNPDDDDDTPQE